MSQSALFADSDLKRLDGETWLAKRITQHLSAIFTGDTDPAIRKERIRRAIITGELDLVVLGKNPATGKSENYAEAFSRLYGEPLQPKGSKK